LGALIIKAIRRFIERGRKGYCYEDLWSWDYFFSKLIARSLKDFRQIVHGYPTDVKTFEDWLKILDEIIDCFEEQTRSDSDNTVDEGYLKRLKEREKYKQEKLHKGLQILEKYYYRLWD